MGRYVLCIVCLSICLFSCEKKAAYRIEGELSNLEDSVVYAVFEGENIKSIDTVYFEADGTFKIENDRPEMYDFATLFFNGKKNWVTVYLERDKLVKMDGDAFFPDLIEVTGNKTNENLTAFKQSIKIHLKEKDEFLKKLSDNESAGSDEGDISAKIANLDHQIEEAAAKYIRKNPDDYASVILIQTYFSDPEDTRKMDELLALLDPKLKESPLANNLEQFSALVKRTAIGAEAPDFSIQDLEKKNLDLSMFKDRFLLLSFAAPWCDICKTENVYLKEIRKRYPEEKLEMLTITLDVDQQAVRDTARVDSISWHLVSDSAGYASMMIDLYGVGAIPKNYLIDESGKIILKTENGAEVQQTLEKLIQ